MVFSRNHWTCGPCYKAITTVMQEFSGQSYKASTIVNYDSRVVPDLKIPHIMTLES